MAAAATRHGLSGLLAAEVEGAWSGDAFERVRRQRLAMLASATVQVETAAGACDELDAEGLRVLPLKGAAVAELLYDDVGQRPMADVDLFAVADAAAVVRSLQARGWTTVAVADHATALQHPARESCLEVHHAWASCPSLHPVDPAAVWSRRRAGTGRVRRLPSLEDLLLQASLHATFQHGMAVRLVQYVDLVRLARHPELDPARLADAAVSTRTTDALALALCVAHELAGDVPLRSSFPLPRRLAPLVRAAASDPESVLTESGRRIAGVRWALARGRRLQLLRDTFAPRTGSAGLVGRALRVARHLRS